ncbi:hypothetical protein GN244_ATG07652 [Phytophthora infestans]|uniref:SWIM-type domain-containing protein n=1 Tax=Phytophthora infestans TaxID=4787 RepID=A0A833WWK7_PHYIN|nr:hypothetical protein GN244_ATG07652 [Phytophthora infestans]
MDSPNRAKSGKVTKQRATRYREARDGTTRKGYTVEDININYLSIQQAKVLGESGQMARFRFSLQPVITSDKVACYVGRRAGPDLIESNIASQIKKIRALYRCDCKAFMSVGWACSHLVVAMALNA